MKKIDRRIFLISLIIFILMACLVALGWTQNTDNAIHALVNAHRNPVATAFFTTITKLFNSNETLAWCILIIILAWRLIDRRFALQVAISSLGVIFINHWIKQVFQRPRPATDILMHYSGYSFPSGHSSASALVCACLILLVWRLAWKKSWKIMASLALSLLILVIGLSRIYVGAHYPSDVLAGWSLGIAIVFGFDDFIAKIQSKSHQSHF